MKIVYCLNSIRYLGGIQRVTIVKANALADRPENEVYIIVTDNEKGLFVESLSPKVYLIDLAVNYYSDDWKSKWNVLKGIFIKRREHKKRLTQELRTIKPDIVVSVGQSEKNFLAGIRGDWATVRELHFTKNYRRLAAHSAFDKVLAVCGDIYDYWFKINAYDQIVVLTKEDKETNWRRSDRVVAIPNPVSFTTNETAKLNSKTIVSVGRLQSQKNYASLIRAFKHVADSHPDWTLEIYGDGDEKNLLQNEIASLGLADNVLLKGYTADVSRKMLDASLYVCSSKFEGLPLVLVEAMSCGLPIVSYACPCGPKDIITEGKDGFLVPVNDEQALADRMCYLIENEDRRKEMGKAAKMTSRKYEVENIVQLWMDLFNSLKTSKNGK